MPSIRLKRVCVFINHDVFANALCDVFEIVLVLQSCGIVLKWWLGRVQLGMSSITVNLDPEFYYLHTVGINYIYTTVWAFGDARKNLTGFF